MQVGKNDSIFTLTLMNSSKRDLRFLSDKKLTCGCHLLRFWTGRGITPALLGHFFHVDPHVMFGVVAQKR